MFKLLRSIMIQLICKKIKHFIVTLRFSILSIFITFFVVMIMLLIALSYARSSSTLLFVANKLMTQVSSTIIADLHNRMMWSQDASRFSAKLIEENVLHVNNEKEITNYFFQLIDRLILAQAVYWGDESGRFIILEREPNNRVSLRIIDPKSKPIQQVIHFSSDATRKIVGRAVSNTASYDPRKRLWYQAAADAKENIWTNIYVYAFNKSFGTTTAAPAYDQQGNLLGVFGVDLRLDYISKFISSEVFSANGFPFIVTTGGKVIAAPTVSGMKQQANFDDIHTLGLPWLTESFEIYKKNNVHQFRFDYQGKTYLASYTKIEQYDFMHDWLVGTIVLQDDFVGDLKNASLMDATIGFLILAIGIFFVSSLITRVVKPIKKLVKQTDKIKHFDLSEDDRIRSRIKEVILLSDAFYAMKTGLKSFQQYVPSSLVRQLIETGEDAHIGGAKKPLTILFSDIKDFTTIAENMEPNQLMEYMCEYFDELSHIIVEEKGTIDKYIGDSIMAFWGAPLFVEDPCQHAARSALGCIKRLRILNKFWEKQGRPVLITRIGLHTGDAVVGNVGSSERINYTVLGDVINIANRLEGMNKIYGTQVMVSEEVFYLLNDKFIFRKIDRVVVKGKTVSSDIYELLAEYKHEITFDIDQYNAQFAKAFLAYQELRWDDALLEFEKCLLIYPDDTVVHVFINRCKKFKMRLPRNWNGVWKGGNV